MNDFSLSGKYPLTVWADITSLKYCVSVKTSNDSCKMHEDNAQVTIMRINGSTNNFPFYLLVTV